MKSPARRMVVVLSTAILIVVSISCQALPGLPTPALDGTGWRATQVAGQPPVAGSEPTVFFSDGRIAGSTGCNGFGGDMAIEGASLKFGEIATTLIGCDGRIGDIEGRFSRALAVAERVVVRADGMLVLSGPAGDLVFRPDPTVGP